MRSFLVLVYLFAYLIFMIPVHGILVLIGKVNPQLRYKIGNFLVYWGFRFELFQSGAEIETEGKENIPEEPVLFVSNHRSYFDILVLHTTSGKRPGFVAKAEIQKFPLLAWWMQDIACLFLDRNDLRSGMQMMKDGAELIKSGQSMVIFPEGTRSNTPGMLPFKEGSLKIAEKADCPVVPVTIVGTDQLLEVRPGFDIRKGKVRVIYGKPFHIKDLPKEQRKKAGAYVQGIIEETYGSVQNNKKVLNRCEDTMKREKSEKSPEKK